jgi:hypothetical protein
MITACRPLGVHCSYISLNNNVLYRSATQIRGVASGPQLPIANFKVAKFGELKVKSGSVCHFDVQPISPHVFPDQNCAFFECPVGSLEPARLNIMCTASDKTNLLAVTERTACGEQTEEPATAVCNARVPIKYGELFLSFRYTANSAFVLF